MTKLAILRRQCRRAKATLMRRWPREYYEERFEDANSEYDLLDGTPVVWSEPDYYSGESDYKPAVDELRFLQMCENADWERLARQWLGPETASASDPQTSRDATASADSIEGEGR